MVLDAEEKTFFIALDTRDVAMMNESPLNNMGFSWKKKKLPIEYDLHLRNEFPDAINSSLQSNDIWNAPAVYLKEQRDVSGSLHDHAKVYLFKFRVILGIAVFQYLR